MMKDIEVKKTVAQDFENIYPLLQLFNSSYSREDWQRIFTYHWEGAGDFVGFHLEHHQEVVGYMGLIFSVRHKNNETHQFCNITSLIVKENYRVATLLLLRQLKTLGNIIFTGLNPIDESYRMLSMLNFKSYESHYKIIPTINYFFSMRKLISVTDEQPTLLSQLDAEHRRIVLDHMHLKPLTVLFNFSGLPCLLLYEMTLQKYHGIPLKKIHLFYISDIQLFNQHLKTILKFFNRRFGMLSALYVDHRFVSSTRLFSLSRTINPPRIYHAPDDRQIEIDELYSEAVLL